ncbi:MAG TPA: DUF2752 domain-containing protein [Bacteroidota bacterium]|nr:DUF2752 domain-containing protein [Bacteroidota bacterium]
MNRIRLYILVIALSLAGYGWTAWNVNSAHAKGPGSHSTPTPCPVRLATGLPCPSCGTTRAVESLAGGDIAGSLRTNPFGLLAALALLAFPPWVLYDVLRSRDGFFRFYLAFERTLNRHRPLALACVALVLANWVWNILKGL